MTTHSKIELRALARRTLARLTEKDLQYRSAQLTERLALFIEQNFPNAQLIATFAALPSEPDLSLLPHLLSNRDWAFPLVRGPGDMTFHRVDDSSQLKPGAYQIPSPSPSKHPQVSPKDIDLVLVPGLAFTFQGQRLGQGAGFYDRFLATIPLTPSLGVSFQSQLIPQLPTEPHDKVMQGIVTETQQRLC